VIPNYITTACKRRLPACARCAVQAAWKHVATPWVYRHPLSPWSEASQTTLRREPPAPARRHEEETSLQEVVAWLRHATVHHLQRGKVLRDTLPLTSLVSQGSQPSRTADTSAARQAHGHPLWEGHGDRGEPGYPVSQVWGAAQRGRDKESNPPSPACRWSLPSGTREPSCGCQGAWAGGQGDPNAPPKPSRRVGGGRVVGTWASHVHSDADGWRRPRACEKRGPKGPSERVSCPRGETWGTGERGTDASGQPQGD
jgi:hypothetical protein